MSASAQDSVSAPSYDVPHERIVSIEHPCIVKNFSNGFKSLGGEQQLKHVSTSTNVTATITLTRLRCSNIEHEALRLPRRIT